MRLGSAVMVVVGWVSVVFGCVRSADRTVELLGSLHGKAPGRAPSRLLFWSTTSAGERSMSSTPVTQRRRRWTRLTLAAAAVRGACAGAFRAVVDKLLELL